MYSIVSQNVQGATKLLPLLVELDKGLSVEDGPCAVNEDPIHKGSSLYSELAAGKQKRGHRVFFVDICEREMKVSDIYTAFKPNNPHL